MDLVARLRWSRAAAAVAAALDGVAGPTLVVGAPGLARVLSRRGVPASAVDAPPAAGGAAIVLVRPGLEAAALALRPGGALVLVAPGPATEHSRRALCAGLVELEQRRAGRLVVTSGRAPGETRAAAG